MAARLKGECRRTLFDSGLEGRLGGIDARGPWTLEIAGFRVVREGKHMVMAEDPRILTIPKRRPMDWRRKAGVAHMAALIVGWLAVAAIGDAHAQPKEALKPFVVEYYYKVKWGHFDEFLRLFKKNHYPLLLKEREMGRILGVQAVKPLYHGTEDGRWDFRVTITWRDVATAHDDFDPARLVAELFPDKALYEREEQRRFELLLAHWDLPLQDARLDK